MRLKESFGRLLERFFGRLLGAQQAGRRFTLRNGINTLIDLIASCSCLFSGSSKRDIGKAA